MFPKTAALSSKADLSKRQLLFPKMYILDIQFIILCVQHIDYIFNTQNDIFPTEYSTGYLIIIQLIHYIDRLLIVYGFLKGIAQAMRSVMYTLLLLVFIRLHGGGINWGGNTHKYQTKPDYTKQKQQLKRTKQSPNILDKSSN